MHDPLWTFFHPRGVAVLGASANPTKLSYGVLHNLVAHGYSGPIYPVNPKGGEIMGLPVYTSIADVPDPVDLAIIVLPAGQVAGALEDCGRRGIRHAILMASGFGELGREGKAQEERLCQVARQYGIRFLGPNCVGVLDTYAPIDTTFIRTMPKRGSIGLVSHSGAVCGGVIDGASGVGVGFSRIISLGNQADIDIADALDSLAADPHTRVVAAYVEGLPNGCRFVEAARRLTARKPLVVLKAGRTPGGSRAVASHTGALAGANEAFLAACRRAGAIPVETLEEMVDAVVALAFRSPLAGPHIAILTNAGGPAAIGADQLDRHGMHLVDLSPQTQARLQNVCPPGTMTGNPVDMLGGPQAEHYTAALQVLLDAPEVDGVMVIFVPQAITPLHDVAVVVGQVGEMAPKPVVCSIFGGSGIRAAARALHAHSVPYYPTPCRAAFGLGVLWKYTCIRETHIPEPEPLADVDWAQVHALLAGKAGILDPQAGAEIIAACGLSVPPSGLAASADEAAALADRMGYPVVLKRVAPSLVHKSDADGVVLGLQTADEVREAFARAIRSGERALIQRMAPSGGLEVIVGAHRDAQFGPLVMVGLGGVYVEVLRDVAFRLAPLSRGEARGMLEEIALGRLLAGVRGLPPRDTEAVVDALFRVGWLMVECPPIAEVDLNPLIVGERGAWAVDVRMVIR
ncbi:MAG: acetate--CoA ligase family protein [Anaerolineae bacterium]|nr:acetate--CoA ligase family protein [Anaerolineae bacterium]MDW8068384.1 acetate--CoA ligase family protein [Anaerolineae bacterium]